MITASLVLYNNDPLIYSNAIASFLNSVLEGEIWISDNSDEPLHNSLFNHPRVHYIHNGANLGFGSGHNRMISRLPINSEFHLILNPDIRFTPHVLPELERVMRANIDIGVIMPRINFPDGTLQRLVKLLPTPIDLILRRFLPFTSIRESLNRRYELYKLPQDQQFEVPNLSGCFLFVRTSALHRVGGFDERYFMYMEDVDLVRQLGSFSTVLYVPTVSVTHDYAKGSYVNRKLLKYHIKSAIKYFNKWGWIFDRQRSVRNSKILRHIEQIRSATDVH